MSDEWSKAWPDQNYIVEQPIKWVRIPNKIPTHDPYVNKLGQIYYSCKCGQILDPGTKSFAALNNHASVMGWKIRLGETCYQAYCVECAKGIE